MLLVECDITNVEKAAPSLGRIEHGGTQLFNCKSGYTVDSKVKMTRRCFDGNWDISLRVSPIICIKGKITFHLCINTVLLTPDAPLIYFPLFPASIVFVVITLKSRSLITVVIVLPTSTSL